MDSQFDLSSKLVLITGASSGIGRATAVILSEFGARIILNGRRKDALLETLSHMKDPDKHLAESFDLTQTDSIPAWVREVVSKAGQRLDGLVHCAGDNSYTPLRIITRQMMDRVFSINLYAALALIRGGAAKGVASENLSIVLASSIASLTGNPGLAAYSASKGALNALARCASMELASKGTRVNCIAPGWVNTPMMEEARRTLSDSMEKTVARQVLGVIEPPEIASLIAFLLSDAAKKVTGQTVVIDGGYAL